MPVRRLASRHILGIPICSCVVSQLLRFHSSPVGVYPKPENAVFVPIAVTLRTNDAERSGCASTFTSELSSRILNNASLTLTSIVHLLQNTPSSPVGELAQLESTLKNLLDMLDRVLAYAQEAAAGKPADAALGRYLMGALGGTAEELGKGGFTSSLQVPCVIS
jgi:translation initiation factor 3 subunit F